MSFPAAQGNDFAGVVEQLGPNVDDFAPGDEVLGTTAKRGSQAEVAVASAAQVLRRPATLSWEVAGGLWTVATTAYATVAAVGAGTGDLVIVAGASGGVGGLAAQLARHRGATVLGVAGESSHEWLRSRDVIPLAYGDGLSDRLRRAAAEAGKEPAALIDTVGSGYVALGVELGIAPGRIDTVVDNEAAAKYGAKTDGGRSAANTDVVGEMVELIESGELVLPIARAFPLNQVREAYALLEGSHPPGKIVLIP